MKDQSLRMPISLRTIDRRPQDALPDGSLHELINLRFTNGALRPVSLKLRHTSTLPHPQFRVLYKHIISESVTVLWGIKPGTPDFLAYSVYLYYTSVLEDLAFRQITGDVLFAGMGNAVTISDLAGEKTIVALFNPDTNQYRLFESLLPSMPLVNFQKVANNTDDEVKMMPYDTGILNSYESANTTIMGMAQDMVAKRIVKGHLIGEYTIRCAWELMDGTIVMHTVPQYMNIGLLETKMDCPLPGPPPWIPGMPLDLYWKFTGYALQYKVNLAPADLTTLKTLYKGIVSSFNLYITNHKSLVDYKIEGVTDKLYHPLSYPSTRSISELSGFLSGEIYYFKMASISLEELTTDAFTAVPFSDLSLLSSQEVMTPGNRSPHALYAKSLFSYNQRVFLGNIKNNLFGGTSLYGALNPDYGDYSIGAAYSVAMTFELETPDGTRTVMTDWEPCTFYDGAGTNFKFEIRNFIGYPDSRAKKAQLWHKGADQVVRLLDTLILSPVVGMNFSFWIYPALMFGWYTKAGPLSNYPVLSPAISVSYWDGDRVQATEFQNPFYYPAINSYRVEGFVLGMATNAVPLGASQFGQFPIFVFTTKGIWALNIGNGDILIDSIRPLSGTICTNGRSIVGIDGGVIFISNEGLMILSGASPTGISDMIMGPVESPLAGMLDYEKVINNPNTYQPGAFKDELDFYTYLTSAQIAYVNVNLMNSQEKEIIVTNTFCSYSYVYNLINKSWYKITQSWDSIINDFSKAYGFKLVEGTYYMDDLTQEQEYTNDLLMTHIETRPIKFGETKSFKKILRACLYGWIHPGIEQPYTFFLFGSVDGRNWFVQQASNIMNAEDQIVMGRTSFSCRSFILIMGGNVQKDSYISGLICDIEKRYSNKLR